MTDEKDLIREDIEAYLAKYQQKELLRFVSVGSVDDGKSTLIGRILYDTGMVFEDQMAAVRLHRKPMNQIWRCSPTDSKPSANRESRSTSPTDTSRPTSASSSSRTPLATFSTRETWLPAHRPPMWP
jgi:hypothetical protein